MQGVTCYINTNFFHVMYETPILRCYTIVVESLQMVQYELSAVAKFCFHCGQDIIGKMCGT